MKEIVLNEKSRGDQGRMGIDHLDAFVLDLDGVVTNTERAHLAAWKQTFDEYLKERSDRTKEPFRPFELTDYQLHVKGRSRYEGVRNFLKARDIVVPYGSPEDPPDRETIYGIGNRKNEYFLQRIEDMTPKSIRQR